jgi:hypothetical protein
MALRLTHVVLSGKLDNTRHYQTRGLLQLRGAGHEMAFSLEMLLHETRVFDCPIEEFDARSKRGEPPPTRVVPCPYLE